MHKFYKSAQINACFMRLIAAVRKMDAQRAMREIPALGAKLREEMGESIRIVTSIHADARSIGQLLLREFQAGRLPAGTIIRGYIGHHIVPEDRRFLEPTTLEYLSEPNGTATERYDGDHAQLLRQLESNGSNVDGLIVVPDYTIYCDITSVFKGQEFRGSGRHRILSLDEATATLFDMQQKRIRYL